MTQIQTPRNLISLRPTEMLPDGLTTTLSASGAAGGRRKAQVTIIKTVSFQLACLWDGILSAPLDRLHMEKPRGNEEREHLKQVSS